jgi:dipeptidyl-peptidase-4
MEKSLTYADYARAEALLPWNQSRRIFNAEVKPVYLGKPGQKREDFWYLNKGKTGKTFKYVDPAAGVQRELFDHARLAASLSQAGGVACAAEALPFDRLELVEDGRALRFTAGKDTWQCDLETYTLSKAAPLPEQKPGELLSPDGKYAAFCRDYNIWMRRVEDHEEVALTTDGERYYDYGTSPESNTFGVTLRAYAGHIPPMAFWSPDSKKLLTQRIDQRQVKDLYLLQNCPPRGQRPLLHTYKYPMVGDEHLAQVEIIILDVEEQKVVRADVEPAEGEIAGAVEAKRIWWGKDSQKAWYLRTQRDHKKIDFYEIDADSGKSCLLLEECGKTYVETAPLLLMQPNVRVIKGGGEFIWISERSGWFNLYRYDARSGELLNPLAVGPFVVWEIKFIDEEGGWVYFTAGGRESGRDPYYQHLYRVRLDGTNMQLLTPEDAEHKITFSPDGAYFVDTFSRVNQPPVSVLRKADGAQALILETADISDLQALGWLAPEPFTVKARDGVTPLYGAIYRPSGFDPAQSYPVIDAIYPGPQHNRTPKAFEPDFAHSLAELGFIVVTLDGMGNMGRSKAFHDVSYGKFTEAGGLEDHICGLRQLAARYPYMDLNRVGIYGHSGGGFASTKAILTYPDFYKVAVSSAGNHDQRGYVAGWGELYNGLLDGDNFVAQANPGLAANLKGKLLLAAGDMDDNVHMAMTMQVADALIKAGKDFDMLILPNRNHDFSRTDVYFMRKLWDYFVIHLSGAHPPKEYAIDAGKLPPRELPF